MNVLVCVEQDLDATVPFQVAPDGAVRQVEPEPVYAVNAGDRAAVELAVRLRETGVANKLTAVALAPSGEDGPLRACLARGIDVALHIVCDSQIPLDASAKALLLSRAINALTFDLILCGHNGPASQLGPVLAELLDLPQATGVVQIKAPAEPGVIEVDRRLERGNREKLACPLPALLAIEPSAAPPRYVSIRARLEASRREVQQIEAASLIGSGESLESIVRIKVVRVAPPRPRPKKMFAPDSSMSAEERLALVISGGMTEKKGDLAEGNIKDLAAKVVRFLRDQKLIGM